MKKFFSNLLPWALSCFVLAATTSWTFATHYCGTIKVDSALFGTPDTCGMKMAESFALNKNLDSKEKNLSGEVLNNPSCCNELDEVVSGSDLYKQNAPAFKYPSAVFTYTCASFFIKTPVVLAAALPSLREYPPPLGGPPIYIYFEQFLI